MQQAKGKIDVNMAQQFLSDHGDSFEKKDQPNERALCGHVDAATSPAAVELPMPIPPRLPRTRDFTVYPVRRR